MYEKTVTKREVLVSIAIICVMILLGIVIADKINDALMTKYQEYNTALQIESDKDLFEYGMRTDIGNAFVYGDLKAVDTVSFDEVPGEYSYIKKVKERYTKHTRTVTKTRTNADGEVETYTEIEEYWTWDAIDSWSDHSDKITFLGVEFDYGVIELPGSNHIDTIKESSKIRYVYYGAPTESIGTLYAVLKDDTISNVHFYHNSTIEETINYLESYFEIGLFWFVWICLTGGMVFGFCYIDNHWLEDKRRHSRYY